MKCLRFNRVGQLSWLQSEYQKPWKSLPTESIKLAAYFKHKQIKNPRNIRLCSDCRQIRFFSQISSFHPCKCMWSNQICVSRHNQNICMGCSGCHTDVDFKTDAWKIEVHHLDLQCRPNRSAELLCHTRKTCDGGNWCILWCCSHGWLQLCLDTVWILLTFPSLTLSVTLFKIIWIKFKKTFLCFRLSKSG